MHHDCVVVPGFGAFVAQNQPAYRAADGTWMPPSRPVSFNAGVSHDDGLICTSIARKESVSYEAARNMVANEVAMMRQRMAAGAVDMSRIGSFHTDEAGSMLFSPCAGIPLSAVETLGLRPCAVAALPVEETEEPAVLEVDFEERRSRSRGWLKIAASAAVLIGLGLTLSTPVAVDRSAMQYASVASPALLDMTKKAPEAAQDASRRLICVSHGALADGAAKVEFTAPAPVAEAKAEAAPAAKPAKPAKTASAIINEAGEGRHYLIVASCESRAKAQRYIDRRPGLGLRILQSDGRFRVYISEGSTREEAAAMKESKSFAAAYPDAWVYTSE